MPSDVENWRGYVSHNLRSFSANPFSPFSPFAAVSLFGVAGLAETFPFSANPAALYPRRLTGALELLPSDCYWVSHSRKLTEIDERQQRCFLVQRTTDFTAKNCSENYLGFSRFPHGPVVNKFYCPASYVYYARTCLSSSLGSTVARDLLRVSQLSDSRHSPVTLDTMWSQRQQWRSSLL